MDQYAAERWETVLHYMVASSQQGGISADAVRTLLQAGLMVPDETQDNAPVITRSGFQFLLMERSSQVGGIGNKGKSVFFRDSKMKIVV